MGQEFVWSPYQLDIFNHIKNKQGSLCVKAVAGSSKTTTIVEAAKLTNPKEPAIFLAFNKHIKEELEKKLPKHFVVKTLNGLGYGAIFYSAKRNGHKCKLMADKTDRIIGKQKKPDFALRSCRGVIRKMVDFAKINGIVPTAMQKDHRYLTPDTTESWRNIMKKFQLVGQVEKISESKFGELDYLKLETSIIVWVKKILTQSIKDVNNYDFNDQIYIPYIKSMYMKKYHWVYCDETQDFSPIQMELIKLITAPSTQVILVGDKNQTLYQFRGAEHSGLDYMSKTFNCKELPLPICYRCGKNIIKEAQKYNDIIQAWDQAPDGIVTNKGNKWNIRDFKHDDYILSRYNAPLVHLGIQMMKENKPFRYTGRAFIKELTDLIKSIKGANVGVFYDNLDDWYKMRVAYCKVMQTEELLSDLSDKVNCLRAISKLFDCMKSKDVIIMFLERVFSDKNVGVSLSTVFRSKGLEADKVYVLDFDLLPSDLMKCDMKTENNLLYVGVTRAKKELVYIQTDEIFRLKFYKNKNTEYFEKSREVATITDKYS